MDFGFHDDVLSLFFNVGSVFVWDSIKNLKCPKTSKPEQIIENKPDEQPILNIEDTHAMLDDVTNEECNCNLANKDVFTAATVTTETAISNTVNITLDDTALLENNSDSDETDTLLDMAIEEENNSDFQTNNFELDTATSNETMMNIDDSNDILEETIDNKSNLNIDNNNVVQDTAVSDETGLNVDNIPVVQEAALEITPSLNSKGKEILLDVTELFDKIDEKNVFLDNIHEPIPRSNMLKKAISFKNMIKKFTIRKSKKLEQNIPTISTARHPQEETISSKAGSSFKEMDFASSSWMITKNCDSVSKRDTRTKRQSPAKQDLHSKKWTLLPLAG
ncbi:hypothetical protein CDAR_288471 [Caerostris darwini]|uniref:Uncharacterized protein n=1 Tax=Caerostris darwini TaxID=1538125 RepID=A0AAV4U1X2_9ARAC|nr:hypothetical protein CDAR_288471 [Caerostris darwini]